jgi:CheY-like chemotaxis protein
MSRSKHILVVDDDADVRDAVVAMFRSRGYSVSSVNGRCVPFSKMLTVSTLDAEADDLLKPNTE